MPVMDALDDRLRDGIAKIGRADLVVGIPSFRNAATIGHVASTVARGLREHFPDAKVALINADGGSQDGTPDQVLASASDVPVAVGRYVGPSGKGSAFHAIFQCAVALEARACAVVDSDLRSITPLWVKRLLGPIVEAQADYVAPLYARHKYDGTITNTIAYPLTRALYGMRIRQPIGGEFGFHADLARAYLTQPVWETDVARFGIDIFMTTTAVARKAKVAQAFLGAKVHDPKDPAADLGPMFTQVVGTLFRLAGENERVWRGVVGSRSATVIGEVSWVEPEAIPADPKKLRAKYEALAPAQRQLWDDVLTAPVPSDMGPDGWARIVFDFLEAALQHPRDCEALAKGLLPLYYARVAEFFEEIADMDTQRSEDIVEVMAKAMEIEKMERLEAVDEGADVAT